MNQIVKRVLLGVAAIICALLAIRLLDVLMLWGIYSWFFQTIRGASGLPDTLTGAMSILLTAACLLLLPTFLSAVFFRRTVKKVAIIAAAASGWLVILFFISQPKDGEYFNPMTGQARFKYAKTPDNKIDLFPLGYQFHPKYGTKLELVTQEVVGTMLPGSSKPAIHGSSKPADWIAESVNCAPFQITDHFRLNLYQLQQLKDQTVLEMSYANASHKQKVGPEIFKNAKMADNVGNVYRLIKYIGPDDGSGGWETQFIEFQLIFPPISQSAKSLHMELGEGCKTMEIFRRID